MRRSLARSAFLLLLGAALAGPSAADVRRPRTDEDLRRALRDLGPGDEVVLPPGTWRGGHVLAGVRGTPERPVVIRGEDPARPPVVEGGGGNAFHLSDCAWIEVRHLVVRGFPGNGLNVDDGGSYDSPAHHVLLEDLRVLATGPRGNHDGIKLSGVEDFVVRGCTVEGWGGSAIDMVGCRRGVVEACRFEGREGFDDESGVQMKGGTEDVLVQTSVFVGVTERAVNLGGSTGLAYFRPAPGDFEARRITVGGCTFVGARAPVAFVTAHGGRFVQNTVLFPGRWALRILQESGDPRFLPCREGVYERNLVVFDDRLAAFANVGPGTRPETLRFRRNAWFDAASGRRRPDLPSAEEGGIVEPRLTVGEVVDGVPEVRVRDSRMTDVGAAAWVPPGAFARPTPFAAPE